MKRFCLLAGLFVFFAVMGWGQTNYVWTGGGDGSSWEDESNWEDEFGDPVADYPGSDPDDTAIIGDGYDVILSDPDIEIAGLTIGSGSSLTLGAALTVSGDITSSGTLELNAALTVGGDVINDGTLNLNAELTVDGDVTNNGTLELNAALTVTGDVTNNGTLELNGEDLSVDGTLNNVGTIGLHGVAGQVTAGGGAPSGIGGTIHYHDNVSGVWVFGDEYENLIVEADMGTAGDLDVSGFAEFGTAITANSISVTGTTRIDADVTTTTGNQSYTGQVTLTVPSVTLSSAGSVSAGAVTGTGLTVEAVGGITLSGANNLETVDLTCTGTGDISYNSNRASGVSVTGTTGSGDIEITAATGNITVASGGITTTGTVLLTADAGNITIDRALSGNDIELTATAGTITGTGTISGTSLTVNARSGITLSGANDPATVELNNSTTGSISYNSDVGSGNTLTIEGHNAANNGNITITEAAGDITVSSGGITTANNGTVTITADTGDINVDGTINAGNGTVALLAENGTVTIDGDIETYSDGSLHTQGGAAVYIDADTLAGSGAITLKDPGTGAVCVSVNTTTYNGTVTDVRIHYHIKGKDILYSPVEDPAYGLTSGSYHFVDSASSYGTYYAAGNFNIYIIDVDDISSASPNSFNASGTGFIEFRGKYTADSVTLNSESGVIRLAANPANDPAEITLTNGAFSITEDLYVEVDASITARGINLGDVSGSFDLTLVSSSGDINVSGNVSGIADLAMDSISGNIILSGQAGNSITPLGDIVTSSANNVTFRQEVYAQSYTQNTGTFTQNAGANIAVNGAFAQNSTGTSAISAEITAAGDIRFTGPVTVNGTTITATGANASIDFTGPVTVNGTTAIITVGANASISFAGTVTVNGTAVLNTGAGNGNINLNYNNAAVPAVGGNGSLGLISGLGIVSVLGQIGSNTAFFGNITVNSAADITFRENVYASGFTSSGGGGTFLGGDIAASGNIQFAGAVTLAKPDQGTVKLSAGGDITLGGSITGPSSDINNLILEAQTVTVSAGSNIHPNGLLTINGDTANNGTITAGSAAPNSTAVIFKGHYNGMAGTLINNNTGSLIDFSGDVHIGAFTHNDTIIQFTGITGTNHEFTVSSSVVVGNVIIDQDNTVTITTTINQEPGKTLTLKKSASLIAENGSGASWIQGSLAPQQYFTSGFYGGNGTIIFYEGSKLDVFDLYTSGTGHTVVLNNAPSNIDVSGNVEINKTFTDGNGGESNIEYSIITMKGNSKTLKTGASVRFGSLVVDGGNAVANAAGSILANNVEFAGSVTINDGKVFDCANKDIVILPGPSVKGKPHNFWEQKGTGKFLYGQGKVEFGDDSTAGHTYSIRGDTTWYTLSCHENSATLQFSNYIAGSEGHRVFGTLDISPVDTTDKSKAITLTRENDTTGYPNSAEPWVPPDDPDDHFWYFTMEIGGKMQVDYVIIEHSFSKYKIPVPTEGTSGGASFISAWPYVALAIPNTPDYVDYNNNNNGQAPRPANNGYFAFLEYKTSDNTAGNRFNVNWFILNSFFYAYTEDSNHNGKIDRIRLQSAFDLNGDFNDFKVDLTDVKSGKDYSGAVIGYKMVQEITGTEPSLDLNSIYVLLDENQMPYDTALALRWSIAKNTTLKDKITDKMIIGNPAGGSMAQDTGFTIDTAPPRITYALAVPGHDQIYFQVSEPLANTNNITAAVSGTSGIPVVPINTKEFIIPLNNNNYGVSDLASGSLTFTVDGIVDAAEPAEDLNSPSQSRPYYFMYPAPKYPQNYNYDTTQPPGTGGGVYQSYIHVHSDGSTGKPQLPANPVSALPNDTNKAVFPANVSYHLTTGEAGAAQHRITDMLISVPPEKSDDEHYFVWPIWAKYDMVTNPDTLGTGQFGNLLPGYGYMGTGTGDDQFNSSGIIWDFSGKRFLEKDDITLQARVNKALSGNPAVIYAFNLSDNYKSGAENGGSSGLWHTGPTVNHNPVFVNMVPDFLTFPVEKPPDVSSSPLFNYQINKNVFTSNGMLEFFFRLNPLSDLLAGQLDIVPGASIPPDWYRRIKPFFISIHDVARQRGNVTILNNVINSEKRERVYLDYKLVKSGRVTVQVFTLDGNLVKVLVRESQNASDTYYRVSWDGTNNGGRPVARGMYFIRIVAPDIDEIRKVMVIK